MKQAIQLRIACFMSVYVCEDTLNYTLVFAVATSCPFCNASARSIGNVLYRLITFRHPTRSSSPPDNLTALKHLHRLIKRQGDPAAGKWLPVFFTDDHERTIFIFEPHIACTPPLFIGPDKITPVGTEHVPLVQISLIQTVQPGPRHTHQLLPVMPDQINFGQHEIDSRVTGIIAEDRGPGWRRCQTW